MGFKFGFVCLFFFVGAILGNDSCRESTILTSSSGKFSDHPDDYRNYSPANRTCTWKIIPKNLEEDRSTTLIFEEVDLAKREGRVDRVEVYEGVDDLYGKLLFVITGSQIPPPLVATGPNVFIKFIVQGDDGPTGKGFSVKYSASSCPNNCMDHGYCFEDFCTCESGYNSSDCSQTVCDHECGGKARGKCEQKERSGEMCACVPGFYGGDCTAPRCEGETLFSESAGAFTDHHNTEFGNENFEQNRYCKWFIRPPPPSKGNNLYITLHFNSFSTVTGRDWVHVYDTQVEESDGLIASLSGPSTPSDLISVTGVMLVTFETDLGIPSEGFSCSYKTEERKIEYIKPTHHESDWVPAFFAFFTFLLGAAIGVVLFNYNKGRNLGGREEEDDDESFGSSFSVSKSVDDDLGNLLEDGDE
eukprot:CAMPEP_0201475896 /NCGR_PEP_ID=MMETSP0151_2-20130828/1220_1 /ASSEMBLY_ACC=CAM_ASM_000257 /TAXON_ID=200890 /ORGANISM="Paramoeba atlantica, Strain 621/1 / CCAP 1560/9" /LENGTH=415 /DNA_ID=CAMNT_0047856107 /DNA_START=92 /DNA_END=1339 /DNA_ORIENTATION=+